MSNDSTLETILISVLKDVCLRCDFVHAEAFKPAGNTMMVQVTHRSPSSVPGQRLVFLQGPHTRSMHACERADVRSENCREWRTAEILRLFAPVASLQPSAACNISL